MRRLPILAAAAAVAFSVTEPRTARAHGNPVAAAAPAGAVTGVSVVPATGRAEVVIAVDNTVSVQNFTLSSPHRIVLDLTGARLGMPPFSYDKRERGGVTNVRFSQYRADVVRVVIELSAPRPYDLARDAEAIRVAVGESGAATGAAEFSPWHSGSPTIAARETPAPAYAAAPAAAASESPRTTATLRQAASSPAAREVAPELASLQTTVLPRGRLGSSAASRQPVRRQQSQQPRITVTYQDTDIRDVIAAFASFSGRTIVVGRTVQGTVTAEIRDQPWDVALNAMLEAQGLAATEDENGIIMVDSYENLAARQASEPLVTQLVPVNYANAASLAGTITSLLSRDCGAGPGAGAAGGAGGGGATRGACVVRGTVTADSATNTLLITDVPSRINDLVGYVRSLDVRTPQVAIKAKIIFVNRTDIEDIGLRYDLGRGTQQFFSQLVQRIDPTTRQSVDTDGDGVPDAIGGGTPFTGDRISLGGNSFSALGNANVRVENPALQLVFSTALGQYDLTTFLDALQRQELADLQAEPTIVTLDNRRAEILVGQEVPVRVIDAGAATGGGAQGGQGGLQAARAQVSVREAGINLEVTPHITNNRQILMRLHAENSDAQLASTDVGVIFNKQTADNQLLVGDGQTAVIGGLTVTNVSKIRSGIPFLMDLPLVGWLFRQTRTQELKRDLLILVTPHIVDEGEAVGTGSAGTGAGATPPTQPPPSRPPADRD